METSKYIRQNKGCSSSVCPESCAQRLCYCGGINPESFLYNWAIYALVVLLWAELCNGFPVEAVLADDAAPGDAAVPLN